MDYLDGFHYCLLVLKPLISLVYSVNYLICLLITRRTYQVGDNAWRIQDLWFTITTPVLTLCPQSHRTRLLAINPRLPCNIHVVSRLYTLIPRPRNWDKYM